jgi:hypothetical protein
MKKGQLPNLCPSRDAWIDSNLKSFLPHITVSIGSIGGFPPNMSNRQLPIEVEPIKSGIGSFQT